MLSQLHREAVGQTFTATYKGVKTVGSKDWDVFAVDSSEPLCGTLDRIYSAANGKAWKGFTSPQDSPRYDDYWIFAQLDENDRGRVDNGGTYTFEIMMSTKFTSNEWREVQYSLKVGFFYKISLKLESDDDWW